MGEIRGVQKVSGGEGVEGFQEIGGIGPQQPQKLHILIFISELAPYIEFPRMKDGESTKILFFFRNSRQSINL